MACSNYGSCNLAGLLLHALWQLQNKSLLYNITVACLMTYHFCFENGSSLFFRSECFGSWGIK